MQGVKTDDHGQQWSGVFVAETKAVSTNIKEQAIYLMAAKRSLWPYDTRNLHNFFHFWPGNEYSEYTSQYQSTIPGLPRDMLAYTQKTLLHQCYARAFLQDCEAYLMFHCTHSCAWHNVCLVLPTSGSTHIQPKTKRRSTAAIRNNGSIAWLLLSTVKSAYRQVTGGLIWNCVVQAFPGSWSPAHWFAVVWQR